jgi:hypothetical protein
MVGEEVEKAVEAGLHLGIRTVVPQNLDKCWHWRYMCKGQAAT